MKVLKLILLSLSLVLFMSCDDEDEINNPREATFLASFLNEGNSICNDAQLTLTFLITYPGGNQESISLSPTEEYHKPLPLVRDSESINLKIFFPSSEDAIAEATIPFIFNGVSDEELEPPGNELLVVYCHSDTSPITWDIFTKT